MADYFYCLSALSGYVMWEGAGTLECECWLCAIANEENQ